MQYRFRHVQTRKCIFVFLFVFSDELKFSKVKTVVSMYDEQKMRNFYLNVLHNECPISIMVWSCMTSKETGRLHTAQGIMKQDKYRTAPWNPIFFYNLKISFLMEILFSYRMEHHTTKPNQSSELALLSFPGQLRGQIKFCRAYLSNSSEKYKNKMITTNTNIIAELTRTWHKDENIKRSCETFMISTTNHINLIFKEQRISQ